jgi:uncharacterized protein
MSNTAIVQKTADFIEQKFAAEGSGHDWWHMYRVWQLAKTIAEQEKGADMFVVELGALLHDIADWKFHDGDPEAGPKAATAWLTEQKVSSEVIDQVVYIVRHISFKGGTNKHAMQTLEGKIVQDADRLDAIGAIGIARTFTFGGSHGRVMYDPNSAPQTFNSFEEFKASIKKGTTVNHFYEKLLLLKDGMHTTTAKKIAQSRHEYMEKFLDEFFAEWEGKR